MPCSRTRLTCMNDDRSVQTGALPLAVSRTHPSVPESRKCLRKSSISRRFKRIWAGSLGDTLVEDACTAGTRLSRVATPTAGRNHVGVSDSSVYLRRAFAPVATILSDGYSLDKYILVYLSLHVSLMTGGPRLREASIHWAQWLNSLDSWKVRICGPYHSDHDAMKRY
jgi:hypothetical protein